MRHTERQRELLYKAWNFGYLSDPTNYGVISEVTGLSRKQVSNWARYQIKKLGDKPRPEKSSTPIASVFKDLPRREEMPHPCAQTTSSPARDKMLQFPLNIPSQQKQMQQEWVKRLSEVAQNICPPLGYPLQEPKLSIRPVEFEDTVCNSLPCTLLLNQYPAFNWTSHDWGCNPGHPGNSLRHTTLNLYSTSNRLSPIQEWCLLNAIKTVNGIDDAELEDLEKVTNIKSKDIVDYLLNNGWNMKPAVRGIRYVRTVNKFR
jgi:hypothetical protein